LFVLALQCCGDLTDRRVFHFCFRA
jgi:hypothetical protein